MEETMLVNRFSLIQAAIGASSGTSYLSGVKHESLTITGSDVGEPPGLVRGPVRPYTRRCRSLTNTVS
jgi:hypothetical protein